MGVTLLCRVSAAMVCLSGLRRLNQDLRSELMSTLTGLVAWSLRSFVGGTDVAGDLVLLVIDWD